MSFLNKIKTGLGIRTAKVELDILPSSSRYNK